MTADPLREAAALMRQRAEEATHGDGERLPWFAETEAGRIRVYAEHYGTLVAETVHRPEAAHIASWHPAVALAVADWLDEVAHLRSITPGARQNIDGTTHVDGYLAALAVARAYLGRDQ